MIRLILKQVRVSGTGGEWKASGGYVLQYQNIHIEYNEIPHAVIYSDGLKLVKIDTHRALYP